jgi:hypothetical protein
MKEGEGDVQDGENIILSIISISKTFSLSTYKTSEEEKTILRRRGY